MLSLITNYDRKLLFTMKPGICLYRVHETAYIMYMDFVVLVKKNVGPH